VAINEWSEEHDSFFERGVPLRFLKDEMLSALGLGTSAAEEEEIERFRSLGRNESVKRGAKNFNIQTEVRVGDKITITTMVFEGGSIMDNNVRHCLRSEDDLIKKVSRVAGMQHYEAVAKVRRGRFD